MVLFNPYMTFEGNCEKAFTFYKSVFGGEFSYMSRFDEMPPQEGMPPMPKEYAKRIMHVSLPVGKTILMGSDSGGDWGPKLVVGNNIAISIGVKTKEEADMLFKGLSKGGKVIMKMGDTFWGSYYGMFTDKFGIGWMISADMPKKDMPKKAAAPKKELPKKALTTKAASPKKTSPKKW